jgi:hypothetical protein
MFDNPKVAVERMFVKLNKRGNVRINVVLRRVLETIVAVQKQYVSHIPIVCLHPY